MPWVKLSDSFAEDPRIDEAGPLALALHVAALCYSARQLTDGRIPSSITRRLLDLEDPTTVAKRLVAAGVWSETEDGFAINDYLDDQPSRAHVLSVRAKRVTSGRAGGRASGEVRRSKDEPKAKQVASPLVEPPTPTRPDPSTTGGTALTGPDLSTGLVMVAEEDIPPDLLPDRARLVELCTRLADDGWSPDELRTWTKRQRWSGASGPGAVVHRLGALGPEDRRRAPQRVPRSRAARRCENDAPVATDGSCCGRAHASEVDR
jgi:hypothetical protein